MGFSEVPLTCDFNRLTEKHVAIAIDLVSSHCHETQTEATATRPTSTQDKAPAATDKQTVQSHASAFGWMGGLAHSTTFSPVRNLDAATSPSTPATQGDQKTKVQTVALQAAQPKNACSTEAGRGGPMRRERNNAKAYMPARSIPPAEPDQNEKQRRTKSLIKKYRVEIFWTERPESDTVALNDDARWRNEEALQAYGMHFGRVLDCFTVNIRLTAAKVDVARAYISFDSEGAVESALSTEACIQGICLEVKRLPYEQDEDRGRQRDRCTDSERNRDRQRGRDSDNEDALSQLPSKQSELNKQILNSCDMSALFTGRDGPDRQTGRGTDRDDERGRERVRYNERERTRGRELGRDRKRDGDRERGSDRDRKHTLTQRPSKRFNIELNENLMRINDTRELCDFVLTHAAEFNHVNVATAFRQILKNQRGIPPKSLAQALQTLEKSALQNMQDFGARHIANTLHTSAKHRYKPTGNLLLALERRAEAISGEFDSQAVANTLWAFATMGTKPGKRMMGQLERQAEAISGEFKFSSQSVASTLWAFATMGTKPGEQMMGLLAQRVEIVAGTFIAQEVSSTLWALAEMGWRPYKAKERMMGLMEGRVEATSATFNSQDVAKTLWAYATMKRRPGERMMELLEGRVEELSGQFSSQNIAKLLWAYDMLWAYEMMGRKNVLWAYERMGRKLGERMTELLERQTEETEPGKGEGTLLNDA